MNLVTGAFDISKDAKLNVSHLSAAFGLPEVCAELIELLDVPEFERAWLLYCELYNGSDELQKAALGESFGRINLQQGHARLTAFAAYRKKDAALAARAWQEFTDGRNGYGPRQQFTANRIEAPAVLNPVDEVAGRLDELHRAVGTRRDRVPRVHAQVSRARVRHMKHLTACLLLTCLAIGLGSVASAAAKPRVFVLTDIENEPDDAMSMVRFLVYANQWDVEGLVATTSVHQQSKVAPWRIREIVDAYAQGARQPRAARAGFPSADALRARHRRRPARLRHGGRRQGQGFRGLASC